MPIYEFECTACGVRFDRLQKISDPDPTYCPKCTQSKVRRRLTAPAFRLAGSGWYETDFKDNKDKKRNLAEKGETASENKSETKAESSTGSDTKPATSASNEATKTPTSTTNAE